MELLAAAAWQTAASQPQSTVGAVHAPITEPPTSSSRRSLRTTSNISSSTAGALSTSERDARSGSASGNRIKGKMTQHER